MVAGLLLSLLAAAVAPAAPLGATTINWFSTPAFDGETVLASGGGPFTNASIVTLSAVDGKVHTVPALEAHAHGFAFKLPAGLNNSTKMSMYDISVDGGATAVLNAPETWWWQGDAGNTSTPGGWLRAFGRSMSAATGDSSRSSTERTEVDAALQQGDYAEARRLIDQLEAQPETAAVSVPSAKLRLTPVLDGRHTSAAAASVEASPVVIPAVAANSSVWEARFELPASLAPGRYTAEISSGLASPSQGTFFPMRMFSDGSNSAAVNHTLEVVTITKPHVWPTQVFTVDCEWEKPIFERPCGWVGARSSAQVDAALAQARAAGGGIVHLPRGQYYIDGPIIVPPNTRLRGEATDLVAVYFREQQPWEAPTPGYVHNNGSAAAWAVQDLSLYISSFYHSVIYVHPSSIAFALQRVRVRAAAYAMLDSRQCGTTCGGNSRGNNISCLLGDTCPNNKHRFANFSHMSAGEVVMLAGNVGYSITDCDLLGTAIIIHTGTHGASQGRPAQYGYIARNVLHNANAAHCECCWH